LSADRSEKIFSSIFALNSSVVIDTARMGPDILGEDGTFAAAGCADYCEITAAVGVQKVGYGRKYKFAPDKILAFFSQELLKFFWVRIGRDGS
jgi:hypothetical protein